MFTIPKIFYGWIIVFSVFVSGSFAGGVGFWGIGIFVIPMESDLGWSRTTLFGALSIRALVGGFFAPVIGPYLDSSRGPRFLAITGSIVLGVSLIGIKYVETVWQFYLLYGVMGSLSMLTMGQNMAQVIVPKWFIKKRGRALGFATMGTPLSGIIFPIPLAALIASIGWRDTWFLLGVTALVLLVPAAFLIRTRPEDKGLVPDGESLQFEEKNPPNRPLNSGVEMSYTRSEAMRSRSFWLILLAVGVVAMGVQGFQPNWLPYFQEVGFTATTGATAIAIYGFAAAAARLIWGSLGEKFLTKNLMVTQTLLTALMIGLLFFVKTPIMLFAYAFFQGLTLGGQFILQPLMVANYFGRQHLGSVRGVMRPFITIAGAIGPVFVAGLFDATGTYKVAFIFVLSTWVIAALIYLFAVPKSSDKNTKETTANRR